MWDGLRRGLALSQGSDNARTCRGLLPRSVERKALVKSLAIQFFVLLFVGVVVACAFHGTESGTSTGFLSKEAGTFCVALRAVSVQIILPFDPVPYALAGESVHAFSEANPSWMLANSIDHPPRQSA